MFRGRFVGFLLAVLLVAGLLSLAGSSIYRAGWTQGYFVGKISDGGEAGRTAVVTPDSEPGRTPGYVHSFSPAGSFFGAIVKVLLVFFLIGMFFKFIGLLFWHKHGWHGGRGGWSWHGSKHYGHTPPWYNDESEEPVMKA